MRSKISKVRNGWDLCIKRGSKLNLAAEAHSPRDRILWILANNVGKMERSRLRASTGMRYALLNPILDELVKEGKIRIETAIKGI